MKEESDEGDRCLENWHKMQAKRRIKILVRVLSSVFDRLQHEITIRFTRLQDLNMKFGFLLDVENLVKCEELDALRQNCQDLGNFYDTDIDGRELSMKLLTVRCC